MPSVLGALTVLVAIANALASANGWNGSRVRGDSGPASLAAVVIMIAVLGVLATGVVVSSAGSAPPARGDRARACATDDRVAAADGGERLDAQAQQGRMDAVERIPAGTDVLAVPAFACAFSLFSGAPV